jgi:hypothetical protein
VSSGGGSKTPTSQTVTQSNIPDQLMPFVIGEDGMLPKAAALTDIRQNPYVSYGGQRVAGFTPMQQQAQAGMAGLGVSPQTGVASGLAALAGQQAMGYQNYQPAQAANFFQSPQMREMGVSYLGAEAPQLQQFMMGPAERVRAPTFSGRAASDYMSPYLSNVIESQKRGAVADYSRQFPQLGAMATRVGGLGGTRSALVESEAQRNLFDRLSDIETQGLQSGYMSAQQQFNADQARRLQAQLANQQAGISVGGQNLQSALQTQGLGAGQSLQAQLANQQAQLQAQGQGLGQLQGLNQLAMQGAGMGAQYGLEGARFGEASRQFGANLGLQGLQQQLAAAGQLGQLGQQQYGQQMGILEGQQKFGAEQQALQQQNLSNLYQDFLDQRNYPYKQLGFMSDLIRGTPTGSSVSTMYSAAPSALGQVAGLGLGLGSLYGAMRGG